MTLLARMLGAPLCVDVRPGAVAGLAPLLADRRISRNGDVAVVLGPGLGEELARLLAPSLARCGLLRADDGTIAGAWRLVERLRQGSYDAVVGIGGGRTIDAAKYAATMVGLPMVAVATSLAHDGLASPVSSLEVRGRKASLGVQIPIAVVVDLDYVRRSPARQRRSGIGDAVSNLSAVADWELARQARDEPVDGLAVTLARTAADAVLHRADTVDSEDFLAALAGALVMSGLAMSVAGSSRPCSGGCHEISHALDVLHPGVGTHGEQAGLGALFASFLRKDPRIDALDACLRRHGLPRLPSDLGLTQEQFTEVVVHAPETRPERYTVLEHLALDWDATRKAVHEYVDAFDS